MAMEVTPEKQLAKHAIPVIMVVVALTATAMVTVASRTATRQTEDLALRDLTARVLHIHPDTNGLAKVTLNSDQTPEPAAGASLSDITQTGSSAQLSLKLDSR